MQIPGDPSMYCYNHRVTSVPILGGAAPATSPPQPTVQLGVAVQQQPNGKHMVVTNISGQYFSFSYALPPEAADNVSAKLGEMYGAAADHARRADLGLITPPIAGGNVK